MISVRPGKARGIGVISARERDTRPGSPVPAARATRAQARGCAAPVREAVKTVIEKMFIFSLTLDGILSRKHFLDDGIF